MADKEKYTWLKVLIGFMLTLMLAMACTGAAKLESKLDTDTFDRHERYQTEQFDDIKESLNRIEDKL